jgi:oligopeptide/dipeptide ABC transporter ATP-binding protein
MTQPLLSLRDLRVSFDTPNGMVQAVRGIDLDVSPGETVGVVGESGSGKSVTFLGIMGLLGRNAAITGSAMLGDTQLIGAKNKVLRSVRGKRVAMIFQDPLSALNPVYRIGDQIVEMLQSHSEITSKAGAKRAVELLEMVGIPQPSRRVDQYPHEFSGGMRQRVMIAMAMANDPDVLIADEPTTALDVTVQAQILEVIQSIQRQTKTAVVMITHDLGVIARVADRVHVMYAGRIVEEASVDALYRTPTHPYTSGLLASLPHPDSDRFRPIPGRPPNMLRPPSGCAFRARCEHATEQCLGEVPPLRPVGASMSACVRADEIVGALA